jgi:hypothetical protein
VVHTFESPGPRTVTLDIETSDGTVNRTSSEVTVILSSFDEATAPLVENARQLSSIVESPSSVGQSEGTIEALRGRLDTARAQIDSIENDAVSDQIATARTIADFQEQLINDLETSITFATAFRDALEAYSTIQGGFSEITSDLFADAVSAFETSVTNLQQIRSGRSGLQTAQEQLSGTLGRDTLAYGGPVEQYVAYSQSQLNGLESLTSTLAEPARAFRDLLRGREAFTEERWQDALDQFTTAEETRQSVADTTIQLEDDVAAAVPVPNARQVVQGFLAPMSTVAEPFSLHVDAARAATNGNIQQAQSTFNEATTQVEASIEQPQGQNG